MTSMKTSREGFLVFFPPILEAYLVDGKCPPDAPTKKSKSQFLEIVTVSLQNKRDFYSRD